MLDCRVSVHGADRVAVHGADRGADCFSVHDVDRIAVHGVDRVAVHGADSGTRTSAFLQGLKATRQTLSLVLKYMKYIAHR